MDRDFLKGLKIGAGFFSVFLLFLSVYAVGYHNPSDVVSGIFQGDYTINGSLSLSGTELNNVSDGLVPSDTVIFYNGTSCPNGWEEVNASRGRVLVGMPDSGTLNAKVGNALSDQGKVSHNHTINPPNTQTTSVGDHKHLSPIMASGGHGGAGMRVADHYTAPWGTGTGPTTDTETDEVRDVRSNNQYMRTGPSGSHSHYVDISSFSSSDRSTNLPYLQLLVCKKQ